MKRALLWAQQLLAGGAIVWGGVLLTSVLDRTPRFGARGGAELLAGVLIGLAPVLFGVAWTFFVQRALSAEGEAEEERAVVAFALKNGGLASALTASVGTGLAVKVCDRVLRRLQREGHAELDVSEAGALVYRFPSLLAEAARLAAAPSPAVVAANVAVANVPVGAPAAVDAGASLAPVAAPFRDTQPDAPAVSPPDRLRQRG